MSQTAYNMMGPESISGMLDDASGSPKNIVTRNNPLVEIPFGRAVAKIAGDDDGIKLPDGGAVTLEGVCLESRALPEGSATLDSAWPVKSAVPILRRGRVRGAAPGGCGPGGGGGAGGVVPGRGRAGREDPRGRSRG